MPVLRRWAVPFLAATSLAPLILALFAPLAAVAQQTSQMRRIGVLMGPNAKTANALGLTIPPSLLLRADQVIDRNR